jgi:hypothetical protein
MVSSMKSVELKTRYIPSHIYFFSLFPLQLRLTWIDVSSSSNAETTARQGERKRDFNFIFSEKVEKDD